MLWEGAFGLLQEILLGLLVLDSVGYSATFSSVFPKTGECMIGFLPILLRKLKVPPPPAAPQVPKPRCLNLGKLPLGIKLLFEVYALISFCFDSESDFWSFGNWGIS